MSRGKGHELGEVVVGTGRGSTRLSEDREDCSKLRGTATAPHDEDVERETREDVRFTESVQAVKIFNRSASSAAG